MSVAAQPRPSGVDWQEVIVTYEFEVAPELALAWAAELVARPLSTTSPGEYVALLTAYRNLSAQCPQAPKTRMPAQMPARGRVLLQGAVREATQRNPNWVHSVGPGRIPPDLIDKLLRGFDVFCKQFWESLVAESNMWGTGANVLMFLDALKQSVSPGWIIRVQGASWELVDVSKVPASQVRAAAMRAGLKPSILLRARGVRMPFTLPGAWKGGQAIAESLKIAQLSPMRLIKDDVWKALPKRGFASGAKVGAFFSFAPQIAYDVRDSKLASDITNVDHWKDFAVLEAKNQSGNLVGYVGGMLIGGALVTALGITAAPAVIAVGLLAGAASQAGFNALGFGDGIGDYVKEKLGR
ncbi:MAG TPA: hypothetical protein VJR89_16915 [Polyangiales bacterium]|nr:hypothetical protein [Polyangiales bacterium]